MYKRQALDRLPTYDWLVFTSVNGVRFFRERLDTRNLDARALAGIKVAAIGPATAEAVRALGVRPDCVPESYVAESVAEGLLKLGAAQGRVLLPRAREAREVLPDKMCIRDRPAIIRPLSCMSTLRPATN